jgi:predicted O-methyltransferase YrrM
MGHPRLFPSVLLQGSDKVNKNLPPPRLAQKRKKSYASQDWLSPNLPTWREYLYPLLAYKEPLQALEIGSYEGRSACWLMENMLHHPQSSLTCIDNWDGKYDGPGGCRAKTAEPLFNSNVAEWGHRIRKIKEDSIIALSWLISERAKFNFIYVDGCHEGFTVLSDLLQSWQLLENGGFLIADDYRWHGEGIVIPPSKAWDVFVSMNPPGFTHLHTFRQNIVRKVPS